MAEQNQAAEQQHLNRSGFIRDSQRPPPNHNDNDLSNHSDFHQQQSNTNNDESRQSEPQLNVAQLLQTLTTVVQNFTNTSQGKDFSTSSVKIKVPEYSGTDTEDLDQWISYMEFVIKAKKLENPETVYYAATGLRKEPAEWYLAMQQENSIVVTSWEHFKTEIIHTFGHPQPHDYYLNKLINLRQGNSTIQKYNNEFSCLIAKMIDMGEADKLSYYLRGLKSSTQMEVKCRIPNSWYEAREMAVIIETTKESITTQQPTKEKQKFKSNWKQKRYHTQNEEKITDNSSSKRTEVANSSKTKPNYKWTKDGKIICFKCNKVGHKAADCRSSRTVATNETLN